mgnify:CR=1 FL=1
MYAIIETGGKQYKIEPGTVINVEKLKCNEGEDLTLDKVLMINKDEDYIYGSPYIEGAKVIASVIKTTKGKKILVFKQKPRKGYRRLKGHRQYYTTLKIKDIIFGG